MSRWQTRLLCIGVALCVVGALVSGLAGDLATIAIGGTLVLIGGACVVIVGETSK